MFKSKPCIMKKAVSSAGVIPTLYNLKTRINLAAIKSIQSIAREMTKYINIQKNELPIAEQAE